jgi:hypothetical protein
LIRVVSSERDGYRVQDAKTHDIHEHGLCIGKIDPRKVVDEAFDKFGKPCKKTKVRDLQNREWVSIIECISGGEISIQPLVIFEGVNVDIKWAPDDSPPYKHIADLVTWIMRISLCGGYKRYSRLKRSFVVVSTRFYYLLTIQHT